MRNLETVSEQRQKSSVGGVFLVIVIQIYGQLERSSPTPQTSSIYTFVVAAPDKDLSERPQAQLYASLLPGGIPLADGTWVGFSVQLDAAVYGLVNAPTAWRKTIVRGIESLGYRGHATLAFSA